MFNNVQLITYKRTPRLSDYQETNRISGPTQVNNNSVFNYGCQSTYCWQ